MQRTFLARSAGVSRFVYNWACARWSDQSEARKSNNSIPKPSPISLEHELQRIKPERYPWMSEVSACIPHEAIVDLGRAFVRYYQGKSAYPSYHKKGIRDSFRLSRGFFQVDGNRLFLPEIGWVRMHEEIRFPLSSVFSVTISRSADRWFASFACRIAQPQRRGAPDAGNKTIGIDVGVHEFVCSNGVRYPVPRVYRGTEKALRRACRSVARKEKGSANYQKQKMKIARLYRRIADIRADWLHKTSTEIVLQNAVIGIEDLDVASMKLNRCLAKSVSDAAFSEFIRQVKYKAEEVGHIVVVADKYFPSSKLCSECGAVASHLRLDQREWVCPSCETVLDRDLNAAINLSRYAARSAVSACGEFLTSGETEMLHQVSSVKQEPISNPA